MILEIFHDERRWCLRWRGSAAMPKRRSPNRFTGLRMLLFAARFR
jgi:hypothetical protein